MRAKAAVETSSILDRLISEVKEGSVSSGGPERMRSILAEALTDPTEWLDPAYEVAGDEGYTLYPLYRAPDRRCSMLAAALKPGVPLPIHDHGSWAVIGIYRGRERDTWYRRTDDGSVPGRARLEVARTFVNPRGSVTIVPDGMIHTVEGLDGRPAVSFHIYGTDIVTQVRSTFDLGQGTVEIFRPEYEERGAAGANPSDGPSPARPAGG